MPKDTKSLYSVTEAAKALDISPSTVRYYSNIYTAHLSDTANRRPRQFDDNDLRIMAYANYSVNMLGRTHDQTLDRIIDELNAFEWEPPATRSTTPADIPTDESRALVPVSLLQAAQSMLRDRDERIEALEDDLRIARGRIEQLQHEAGRLQGNVEQLARPWWKRLLGME